MTDRVLKHLPEYYRLIVDFNQLSSTETVELNQLQGAVDQLFNDQYVLTASSAAIRRRELMLGIQADPDESLQFRCLRILNRYQTKPPFTIRYLQQQLDRLVGSGMTLVSVDPQAFLLTVTTNLDDANVFREIHHTIDTIKPANMLYQQHTSLDNVITMVEKVSMKRMTWNYGLDGGWRLGQQPFVSYGQEVRIT